MTIDVKRLPAIATDGWTWRLSLFSVGTFALYQWLYWLMQGVRGAAVNAENGPVEILQGSLAAAAAIAFFLAARQTECGRAAMTFCGCVVGYAAARESDAAMEYWLFDDAYKYLVGLPLAVVAAVVIYRDRNRLLGEALWVMKQPAAVLYIIAGVYLAAICQLFDRPDLWGAIKSPAEAAAAKANVEELAELFAYLLFAFSAAETYLLARGTRAGVTPAVVEPVVSTLRVAGEPAQASGRGAETSRSRTAPRRRAA